MKKNLGFSVESSFRPLFFKVLWSAMGTDKQLWKQHIDPNVKKISSAIFLKPIWNITTT